MSNRKLILAMLACLLVLVCTACIGCSADPKTEAAEEPDTEISEEIESPEDESESESESDSEDKSEEETEEKDESEVSPDFMAKLDAIEEDSLSTADLAYYTEVNARITKKLAEIA